jgi:outer membrane receptor protein involved in Fe transport
LSFRSAPSRRLLGSAALVALACAARAQAQPAAPTPPAVSGVTVTAQRPVAQTLLDRKVYGVANDLQSTTGSAADVLNNVPSVAVDADGNISLRGDSNVTVLIDGKPSAQFSGASRGTSLLNLPASDIARVEVLTTPPAQYKAEGSAGVINIITKKTRKAGFSGSGQLSLGDKRRYVFGLDGAYNSGPLRLSGGIGLRQDFKRRFTDTDRVQIDPASGAPVASAEGINEQFLRRTPLVKASADYDLDSRRTVGATFNHRETTGHRYFDQQDESGPPGAASTSVSDRHSDGFEWNVSDDKGLSFQQKLGRPGETLDVGVQRSAYRERERYAYANTYPLPPADPTHDDLHLSLDLVKTEVSVDYDLPLAHEREWKLGYDLGDDHNAFDNMGHAIDPATGAPIVEPGVTSDFRYHQQINAAYLQYERPLGPWRLQTGVRLESSHVSFFEITGQVPGGWNGFAAYPSLHLERDLGDADKLMLGIARRVTRPDPEALNPFTDYQDTHNLRAGNPNLKPQDTWTYELGWQRSAHGRSFGLTGYYRFDRNAVTDVLEPVAADVVLATKENLPKSRSAGLEFNANGKLPAGFAYNLSGEAFWAQIDAQALGAAGLASTTGVNLKASLDWRPTSHDTAQISFSRTDRRLTPQGYVNAIDLVNLGYRRQLRSDLALVITVSDALNGQRLTRTVNSPALAETYVRHQVGRIAYAGLLYTFGAVKKDKAAAFDYDR